MKWLKQILFLAAIVLAFSSRAGAQNPVCSQFSFTVAKGLTATCTASAGINAGQILMISGSGVAPLTAGATSGAFAVALTQASSGQTLVVLISGQAQISSDGACAVGKYIIPSSSSAGNGHCTSLPGSAQ
jgi:hypothetical protein